jgi:hypothetical protein
MFSLRKRYKLLLVLILVVISFYAALANFNIINVLFGRSERNTIDYSATNRKFSQYPNFKKIEMSFEVKDFKPFEADLTSLLQGPLAHGSVRPLFKDQQSNHFVGIYEVPDSISGDVYAALRKIGGYNDETVNTASQQLNISIEENLANKNRQMKAFMSKYDNDRTLTEGELSRIGLKIDRVQHEIDSLRNLRDDYASNARNHLLYLRVFVNRAAQRTLGEYLQGFLKTFIITFLILTAMFFVIFFATSLTLRLMSYFGIRSTRSASGYGGYYNRNYGGYGGYSNNRYGGSYGGYGRRRKIKRVYKDKESDESSQENPESK